MTDIEWVGLGCLGFGIFMFLCFRDPPPPNQHPNENDIGGGDY